MSWHFKPLLSRTNLWAISRGCTIRHVLRYDSDWFV